MMRGIMGRINIAKSEIQLVQPFIPVLCRPCGDQDYLIPLKELKPMLDLGDDALGTGCCWKLWLVSKFAVGCF